MKISPLQIIMRKNKNNILPPPLYTPLLPPNDTVPRTRTTSPRRTLDMLTRTRNTVALLGVKDSEFDVMMTSSL